MLKMSASTRCALVRKLNVYIDFLNFKHGLGIETVSWQDSDVHIILLNNLISRLFDELYM